MSLAFIQSTLAQTTILSGAFAIGVASRPLHPNKSFLVPVMLASYLIILFKSSHETPRDVTYQLAFTAAVQMVQGFDYIVIHDARHILYRKDTDPSKPPIFKQPLLSRLLWSFNLMINWRGANWNFEAPNLRHATPSRRSFAASRLVRWLLLVVAADAIYVYSKHNAILRGDKPFGTYGYMWQAWNVVLYWTALYCFQQSGHSLLASFCVGVGLSTPDDWPLYHGCLSDIVSVRSFWGRFWQQGLRRPLSTAGKYIANTKLKYPKGSIMSRYIQLYVAFFLSGVFHASGDWAVTKNPSSLKANITYYILQAVIITLEDGIVEVAGRLGIQTDAVPRVLLYGWVLAWQTITCPMWFETMLRVGLNFEPPFSLIGYFLPSIAAPN